MKKQISIIGCGWLGLSLAKFLIENDYKVKGSTTSEAKLKQLNEYAIDGHLIRLNETGVSGNYSDFLADSDTVIINIPPGLRRNPSKNHVKEIKHLVKVLEKENIKNVLYVSSTSVFKDDYGFPIINNSTEPNATSNSSKQLIEIEELLIHNSNFNTTILRFGGLFGDERHPANYLSGRTNIANAEAPINLIHKEDCIQIIALLLKNNFWNKVLNAVYPIEIDKKTYYSNYCKRYNLLLPEFDIKEKSKGKIIDSSKLVQLLNYTFKQAP
ncbi:hypothetical protein FBALC1_00882 [Flavobacteriales bacterium ALC-1]|nr:hypothetical protein FBALC1_00882 [Flavobacteriales bacterium ALC-1]